MSAWKIAALALLMTLAGCGRDDSEAALQQAAEQLQTTLENKQVGDLMELLHADFQAQRQYDQE
ncbi:hypothetical protein FK516_30970, partial [Klebsiella pneumoniae]|nr:hypothetical protein [Klebsiella pneumoniae]